MTAIAAETLLARLVAFDTTSSASNLALIDWVADYLDGHGIAARLTYNDARTKANLYATIGPEEAGGVVLSGHTDVVPVSGQTWTSDPFTVVEREDRLYGRGTADMKGFIAAALALVPEFRQQCRRVPIHLALSFDEEVGCLGVPHLIADLERSHLPRPRLAIIGEPTSLRVVNRHKGCCVFHTTVTGKAAHSSAPRLGANAIGAAAALVRGLDALAADLAGQADPDGGFDPPFTTVNVGRIDGGTAVNIIAERCALVWEFRPLPGADTQAIRARVQRCVDAEVLPRLRARHAAATVETTALCAVPALVPQPDCPAERLARALTGDAAAGVVSFATEAGIFQQAGIPAVVCGPGAIDQAHQPDEFIERAQIVQAVAFLRKLGQRVGQE